MRYHGMNVDLLFNYWSGNIALMWGMLCAIIVADKPITLFGKDLRGFYYIAFYVATLFNIAFSYIWLKGLR